MEVIEEVEVGLARLDWAITQLAAVEMGWEGAAADVARGEAESLLSELVALRTQLSQARFGLRAGYAGQAQALAGALLGVG